MIGINSLKKLTVADVTMNNFNYQLPVKGGNNIIEIDVDIAASTAAQIDIGVNNGQSGGICYISRAIDTQDFNGMSGINLINSPNDASLSVEGSAFYKLKLVYNINSTTDRTINLTLTCTEACQILETSIVKILRY